MTPREVLLAAADHCDETGLEQGYYWPAGPRYTPGDPCCLVGHVLVASGATRLGGGIPDVAACALNALNAHLEATVSRRAAAWSDAPGRTAAEVAAALRAAAEVAA